ncbi:MAG: hypothetical protein AVDCRST_MAG54-879 [uncultured Actinomycetospora sp.]|uniref:Uncharacterized protein n=1 Tax=uncultured Actinomycetospora sp. TaxID=1135996 RepID=A0A6J4HPW9_9PSEU|nr:MAG: hypothetical protein AVDCRST_MAG54-879 [uncultured Actinomycetospora sp.]
MSAPRGGPAGGGLRARFGGGPRRATGPGEPAPDARPRSYRDATLMINRSREDYLALGIIVLAIGGDIAAFYVVLARVFRGSPFLIVLGTVGFAAAAVGLAHLVGQGLARRRCGDPRASTTLTVLAAVTWLVLGVAAFFSRLLTPGGSSSGGFGSGGGGFGGSSSGIELSAVLPAALFGALFLASGMAAMVATFVSFNPVAGALRRAERRMHDATEQERHSRAELERAREALRQQENEREREDQRWRAARQQVVAEMLELQNYARTLMASKKGNPSVTDGLTGSSFYPLFTPANEVVPGEEAPPEFRPFTPVAPAPSTNGDHR